MAVECCPISFSRATAPVDYHIEGALIARGQDVWIADTEIDSLASGECIRLVGVRMADPSSGQDYLRVCNCSDLCWLKAERTTDPDTGLSKFVAQVPRTCCQCRLEIMVEPCCGPALETVPEDCFGTIRYDTCNPPTFGGDNVGLCYPRGREVPLQFNSWIRCNGEVLYFDRAELFYCRMDAPDEIVRTPAVVVTMPPSTTCPDACVVKVVAYYKAECCQCELRLTADPPNSEAIAISPNDCDGDGPTVTWGADLCYPHGQVVDVDIPYTFEQGGHTYYLDYVEYSRCDYQTPYRVVWTSFEIHLPTGDRCPGDGQCWVHLHAIYRIGCNNAACDALVECLSSGTFTFDSGFQIPVASCGDERCLGCWQWVTVAAQEYFSGLIVPLQRRPDTCELNHYSGRLEEAVCYQSGICAITRWYEYNVRLRITGWDWDCRTGITRIKGLLNVFAGAFLEVPFECGANPPCNECEAPSVTGSAYFGESFDDWVTIGTFESLGEAICATRDWLNAKEWAFNTLPGHGPIDGSVVVEGECCELPE